MKLLQGVTFMNEDNKRRLAEWYGTRPGAGPVGHTDESERRLTFPHKYLPRRPSGSSPTYREPFWSEDGQEGAPPRKKHFGARVAGICTLAVVIIAATRAAVLQQRQGVRPPLSATPPHPATRTCRSSLKTTTTTRRAAPGAAQCRGPKPHGSDAQPHSPSGGCAAEPQRSV